LLKEPKQQKKNNSQILTHSAAPSPVLRRRKEALFRINPNQAQTFTPESRRADKKAQIKKTKARLSCLECQAFDAVPCHFFPPQKKRPDC